MEIYYEDWLTWLWRLSPKICSQEALRPRRASGVIPVWIQRPGIQEEFMFHLESESKQRQVPSARRPVPSPGTPVETSAFNWMTCEDQCLQLHDQCRSVPSATWPLQIRLNQCLQLDDRCLQLHDQWRPVPLAAWPVKTSAFSWKTVRQEHLPLTSWNVCLFVLWQPSADWMRASHVRKDNLLCSSNRLNCNFSLKHPHRHT